MSEKDAWPPLVGMQIVEQARRDRIERRTKELVMAAQYPKRTAWAEEATAEILAEEQAKREAETDRLLTSIEDHIQKITADVDRIILARKLLGR